MSDNKQYHNCPIITVTYFFFFTGLYVKNVELTGKMHPFCNHIQVENKPTNNFTKTILYVIQVLHIKNMHMHLYHISKWLSLTHPERDSRCGSREEGVNPTPTHPIYNLRSFVVWFHVEGQAKCTFSNLQFSKIPGENIPLPLPQLKSLDPHIYIERERIY